MAIKSDSGPALILAGPGSGKTTVLTHHIKYLIDNGVSPDKILVITFTKKAAQEMKSRFEKLSPSSVNRISFGTFHSIFYKIIRSFEKTDSTIVSSKDRDEFLFNLSGDKASSEVLGNSISFYKSLFNKSEYRFVNDTEKEEFMGILKAYNDWLKSKGMIDYDDIIEECLTLLKNNKKAVSYLSNRFSHILVDEFQDINSIQYEALKIIAGKSGIIYAVGDEDQSIYGFRGASPDIMKRFINDYKNVTVINLNTNYRSFQDISDFSQKVIKENTDRLRVTLPTCVKNDSQEHVHLKVFKERHLEISELISDCVSFNSTDKTTAVLLRTNKEVDAFKRLLFNDAKDLDSYKRIIIDDYCLFLDYVINKNLSSLKKIIILAVPNIQTALIKDSESLEQLKKRLKGTKKGDDLCVFETKLNVLKNLNPYSFAMYLRNICGLSKIHKEKYASFYEKGFNEIYDEIHDISKSCNTLGEFKDTLISIKPAEVKVNSGVKNSMLITTFHQSKGLEFDCVFIPDVCEGKVPAGMSVAECRVEEERRLFYVALTRAKEHLFIYTIKNEESGGTLPSRFLNDFYF